MAYQCKAMDCSDSDGYKHTWPLHYHLYKNDAIAAIDELKRGADPLLEDDNGVSAINLTLSYIFKHISKCLSTAMPLGSFNTLPVRKTSDSRALDPSPCNALGGLSDYDNDHSTTVSVPNDLSDNVSLFFDRSQDVEILLALHSRLLRKAKGLLSVIMVMAENADVKGNLVEKIQMLSYPSLYTSVISHLFTKIGCDVNGIPFNKNSVWDCRRMYLYAVKSRVEGIYILKFIMQISKILQELFSLFHVDIYDDFNGTGCSLVPSNGRQLILNYLNVEIVEIFSHLSFVLDLPLLFDVMVLQPKFFHFPTQFNWDNLLSSIIQKEDYKLFVAPLLRKSLRNRVEKKLKGCHVNETHYVNYNI